MDSLIAATVVIGDRTYRIRIAPGDEEVVRHTVKMINDKVIDFKTQFAGKDMQDYIAMVLIWLATERVGNGQPDVYPGNMAEKLAALERLLDNQLSEK